MAFFQQVEGEAAILVENGVYKQVDLYTRDGYLYAKVGNGFVRLMHDGSTTKSRMRLDYMTWEGDLYRDTLGRLSATKKSGGKLLSGDSAQRLLGTEPETN